MPYLIGLTGPYTGQAFEITEGRLTLGRGPACNIVLAADAAVSRAHAVLVTAGGVVQVQDAGSTHGVWVNGRQVPQSLLRTGDCVQVGASCFQLSPVPAQIGDPPRLKVVLPRAAAPGMPGDVALKPSVSVAEGCAWLTLGIVLAPLGIRAGVRYLRKPHPTDRQFGVICLLVTFLSLVAQIVLVVLFLRSPLAQTLIQLIRQTWQLVNGGGMMGSVLDLRPGLG